MSLNGLIGSVGYLSLTSTSARSSESFGLPLKISSNRCVQASRSYSGQDRVVVERKATVMSIQAAPMLSCDVVLTSTSPKIEFEIVS
jgi:hypothetical protein